MRSKGYRLSYSGIDEILVSHLPEMENAGKSICLDRAILQIFKTLKMVFCSSCDGVPLKFKKKNRRVFSLPARIFSSICLDPSLNSLDNTFKELSHKTEMNYCTGDMDKIRRRASDSF